MTPLAGAAAQFALDPGVAHLNHGAFGAVPERVRAERLRITAEHDANPTRFVVSELAPRVEAARQRYAAFLGADPELCALVPNATSGTAIALNSLGLGSGDEIVITDHSYNAVTLAVHDQAARFGAKVVTAAVGLGLSTSDSVAAVLAAVTERTRCVIVDAVSSATAQRHPVGALAVALRAMGIPFIVDAAHAPGMLPRPLSGVDPDFWVGNLHKWAFAPGGTALLRVTPAWRDKLRPLAVSHNLPDGFPLHLEMQGTVDYSPWLAGVAGLDLFTEYGEDEIQRHNSEVAAYGQQVIADALEVDPANRPYPGDDVSMRIIPLPAGLVTDYPAAAALRQRIATELRTEVAINPFRGQGWLRVCAQIYNTPADYERLAGALPALLAAAA
jgi:isopenicillin-N epimerase